MGFLCCFSLFQTHGATHHLPRPLVFGVSLIQQAWTSRDFSLAGVLKLPQASHLTSSPFSVLVPMNLLLIELPSSLFPRGPSNHSAIPVPLMTHVEPLLLLETIQRWEVYEVTGALTAIKDFSHQRGLLIITRVNYYKASLSLSFLFYTSLCLSATWHLSQRCCHALELLSLQNYRTFNFFPFIN